MIATLEQPQLIFILSRQTRTGNLPLVYIAAPYTWPDPVENTHAVIGIADALLEAGFTPFVPHLSLAWHLVSPKPYETWLDYDNRMLARCDVVLRVPGESAGATRETQYAASLRIPVVHSCSADPADCVETLTSFYSNQEEAH